MCLHVIYIHGCGHFATGAFVSEPCAWGCGIYAEDINTLRADLGFPYQARIDLDIVYKQVGSFCIDCSLRLDTITHHHELTQYLHTLSISTDAEIETADTEYWYVPHVDCDESLFHPVDFTSGGTKSKKRKRMRDHLLQTPEATNSLAKFGAVLQQDIIVPTGLSGQLAEVRNCIHPAAAQLFTCFSSKTDNNYGQDQINAVVPKSAQVPDAMCSYKPLSASASDTANQAKRRKLDQVYHQMTDTVSKMHQPIVTTMSKQLVRRPEVDATNPFLEWCRSNTFADNLLQPTVSYVTEEMRGYICHWISCTESLSSEEKEIDYTIVCSEDRDNDWDSMGVEDACDDWDPMKIDTPTDVPHAQQ